MNPTEDTHCLTCGRRNRKRQFSIQTLLLLVVFASLAFALPLRRFLNESRFDEMSRVLQTWSSKNVVEHQPTQIVVLQGRGFGSKNNEAHVWTELDVQSRDNDGATDLNGFEIHLELAPFPSLASPRIRVEDKINNTTIPLESFNELLSSKLNLNPLEF